MKKLIAGLGLVLGLVSVTVSADSVVQDPLIYETDKYQPVWFENRTIPYLTRKDQYVRVNHVECTTKAEGYPYPSKEYRACTGSSIKVTNDDSDYDQASYRLVDSEYTFTDKVTGNVIFSRGFLSLDIDTGVLTSISSFSEKDSGNVEINKGYGIKYLKILNEREYDEIRQTINTYPEYREILQSQVDQLNGTQQDFTKLESKVATDIQVMTNDITANKRKQATTDANQTKAYKAADKTILVNARTYSDNAAKREASKVNKTLLAEIAKLQKQIQALQSGQ